MRRVNSASRFSPIWALLLSSAAFADDPDSYCLNDLTFLGAWGTTVWQVSSEVNDDLHDKMGLSGIQLDDADADNLIDLALQNAVRHGRAETRARVIRVGGGCSTGDADALPCVKTLTSATDGCVPYVTKAFAGCHAYYGCNLVLCEDNIFAVDLTSGTLDKVIAHELGHAYSLKHVDGFESAQGNYCSPAWPCPSGWECSGPVGTCEELTPLCIQANADPTDCEDASTADGCGGDLMCSLAECIRGPFLGPGEGTGLRRQYPITGSEYFTRRSYFGRDGLDNGLGASPTRTVTSPVRDARYAPRIACATASNAANPCAMVSWYRTTPAQSGHLIVTRLSSPTSPSSWSTQVSVADIVAESSMPPDIAINAAGTAVLVTRVSNTGALRASRISLSTGAVAHIDVGVATGDKPVVAPRVAYTNGAFWVLYLEADANSDEGFGSPRWEIKRVTDSGAPALTEFQFADSSGIPQIDLDDNDGEAHAVAADFDFDCLQTFSGTPAECTIVALIRQDEVDRPLARTASIRFTATGTGALAVHDTWVFGNHDANAVLGVAYGPQGSMFVAHGVPLMSATGTSNTRLSQFPGHNVNVAVADTVVHTSDAQTCATQTSFGHGLPAATPHGGYSIAWCPSCGGTYGAVESIAFGLRAGDTNDYCY